MECKDISKASKLLIIFLIIPVVFISYKAINILILPFPLVEMEYINDVSAFNQKPIDGNLDYNFQKIVPEMVSNVKIRIGKDHKYPAVKVLSTSEEMFQSPEMIYPICSEQAKYLAYLAKERGINARVLWLSGHTVAEVYHTLLGWVMIDPYTERFFMHKDNKSYASVTDLITNYDNYVQLKVISDSTENNKKDIEDNSLRRIYENQAVIVELEIDDVYKIHVVDRSLPFTLKSFFIEMDLGGRQWLRPDSKRLGNFNLLKIVGSIFRD
jgi:hypothetical protein